MPAPVPTPDIAADLGIVVTITHSTAPFSHSEMRARTGLDHLGRDGASSVIRVVPLLRMLTVQTVRHLVVGTVRVVVSGSEQLALEVVLQGVWADPHTAGHFVPLDVGDAVDTDAVAALVGALRQQLLGDGDRFTPGAEHGDEFRAAFIAKFLAEESRNAVADAREVRYALETQLAETSARSNVLGSQASIVSALLHLSIVLGRSAENAREAEREGLWVFLTDSEAYHSYRHLQDALILNGSVPATEHTRSWMRLHDQAIRQCSRMREQLDAETVYVHGLLAAAASVSSSREADGQTSFNTLAAVASLGLGIPALVLSLYGADRLLPLDTLPRQFAFLPVAAGLVFAAGLAVRRSPSGKLRRVWLVGSGVALAALLGLLVVAGLIAPRS
jgi:hypothetical protein